MRSWQLQTAKARFSELVNRAADEGPQEISVHGKPVAVVVSSALFERLTGNASSLVEFMQRSPLAGDEDVMFERDISPGREVDF